MVGDASPFSRLDSDASYEVAGKVSAALRRVSWPSNSWRQSRPSHYTISNEILTFSSKSLFSEVVSRPSECETSKLDMVMV